MSWRFAEQHPQANRVQRTRSSRQLAAHTRTRHLLRMKGRITTQRQGPHLIITEQRGHITTQGHGAAHAHHMLREAIALVAWAEGRAGCPIRAR